VISASMAAAIAAAAWARPTAEPLARPVVKDGRARARTFELLARRAT
jgi:hypothetical protein